MDRRNRAGKSMEIKHAFLIVLAAILFSSCQSLPQEFVTPETDAHITAIETHVDAISGAAETLDGVTKDMKAGDTLTETQVTTLKQVTSVIISKSKEAKMEVTDLKTSHAEDNKKANVILVDDKKKTAENKSLLKWVIILGGIIVLTIVATVLKLLGKLPF